MLEYEVITTHTVKSSYFVHAESADDARQVLMEGPATPFSISSTAETILSVKEVK